MVHLGCFWFGFESGRMTAPGKCWSCGGEGIMIRCIHPNCNISMHWWCAVGAGFHVSLSHHRHYCALHAPTVEVEELCVARAPPGCSRPLQRIQGIDVLQKGAHISGAFDLFLKNIRYLNYNRVFGLISMLTEKERALGEKYCQYICNVVDAAMSFDRDREEYLLICGDVTVCCLGKVDPTPGRFHNAERIYPVGYCASRKVLSPFHFTIEVRGADLLVTFLSETVMMNIDKQHGREPSFSIRWSGGCINEKSITDAYFKYRKSFIESVSRNVLKCLKEEPSFSLYLDDNETFSDIYALAQAILQPLLACTMSADEFFGVGRDVVGELIEMIPGAAECLSYSMQFFDFEQVQNRMYCSAANSLMSRTGKLQCSRTSDIDSHVHRKFGKAVFLPRNTAFLVGERYKECDERGKKPKDIGEIAVMPLSKQYAYFCSNQPLLEVKKSRIHDYGLFATSFLPKGLIVIEYLGERIHHIVSDMREKRCVGLEFEKLSIVSALFQCPVLGMKWKGCQIATYFG
uniref:Uncharacterized protein n=1 Tax=Palpitomonas bilix TaxID=652834 RepID=A0A7S3GGD1_9EUKA